MTIDSEIDDKLLKLLTGYGEACMEYVGDKYVERATGKKFIAALPKLRILHDQIKQLIEAKVREVEKAYGGCHKCYGKGYSTTWSGLASNRDFDSPGFVTPPKNHMRFCTCDRGKQLEKQLQSNQEGDSDG